MSAPGHCVHCHEQCNYEDEYEILHCSDFAAWADGNCPACGEAERVAAECERRAAQEQVEVWDPGEASAAEAAYSYIAGFARGEL